MLNLIEHLPRDSYYSQSMANDEEHAAAMLAHEKPHDDKTESGPAMATWSAEVAILADLIDAVNTLRQVLIAANSKDGKGGKLTPYPRPKTVVERVRRRQRRERHEALVARVKPTRES